MAPYFALTAMALACMIGVVSAQAIPVVVVGGDPINVIISRHSAAVFTLDASESDDPSMTELIFESSDTCNFFTFVDGQQTPWPGSLPYVFKVRWGMLLPATTTISVNGTLGTCNATVLARPPPFLTLSTKPGVQFANVQLAPFGTLGVSLGKAGQKLQPFAVNFTSSDAFGWSLGDLYATCILGGGSGPCYFDSNDNGQQYGGSGAPVDGPVQFAFNVGGTANWQHVNVSVVLETPVALKAGAAPVAAGIVYGLSTIFSVPLSKTASAVVTVELTAGAGTAVYWNANGGDVIGSQDLNQQTPLIKVKLPPSTGSWLLVFGSNNGNTNARVQVSLAYSS